MGRILAKELSALPVKIPRIKITEVRLCVGKLPDVLTLLVGGEGAGRDAGGTVGVVVEKLRDRAAGIRHDVGGAEVIGVDVAGNGGAGRRTIVELLVDRRQERITQPNVIGRGRPRRAAVRGARKGEELAGVVGD